MDYHMPFLLDTELVMELLNLSLEADLGNSNLLILTIVLKTKNLSSHIGGAKIQNMSVPCFVSMDECLNDVKLSVMAHPLLKILKQNYILF